MFRLVKDELTAVITHASNLHDGTVNMEVEIVCVIGISEFDDPVSVPDDRCEMVGYHRRSILM